VFVCACTRHQKQQNNTLHHLTTHVTITQEDGVARLPELQFLNKNSKFRSGGRTFKAFKLLARAVRVDPGTQRAVEVLAQVESGTFKVGCVWLGRCVQRKVNSGVTTGLPNHTHAPHTPTPTSTAGDDQEGL
jgi:hypothetical protein